MRTIGSSWSVASLIRVALGFVRFFMAIGLFLGVVATIAALVLSPRALAVSVPVSFSLDMPTPVHIGRPGFNFDIGPTHANRDGQGRIDRVEGSLRLDTDDKRVLAFAAVAFLVLVAFALFVIDQLRAVLKTLLHGNNPFVASNAVRIRRIALAVLIGEAVQAAVVFAENYYARTHIAIAGVQFDAWPHVSMFTIGCGLVILVIAEVFRAGTRLDEEQSLTI